MLTSLIGTVLSGQAAAMAQRMKVSAIVYAVLGVFGLIGCFFLLLAGYLFAAERIGAVAAALWFGGSFLVAALTGLFIFWTTAGLRARRLQEQRKNDLTGVAAATALAALPSLLARTNVVGLAAIPFLAAAGYQIIKENTRPPGSTRSQDDQNTPAS